MRLNQGIQKTRNKKKKIKLDIKNKFKGNILKNEDGKKINFNLMEFQRTNFVKVKQTDTKYQERGKRSTFFF